MIYYKAGDRVSTSPSTDSWMRGDRYGSVIADYSTPWEIGVPVRRKVKVLLDKSNKVVKFHPSNIVHLD